MANLGFLGTRGGTNASWHPSLAILAADVDKLGADIRSFRVPLKKSIQEVVAPSVSKNFDVGGRPAWEPLSDTTIDRWGPHPILNLTGKLKRVSRQLNIWTITRTDAYVSGLDSRIPYAKYHQVGTQFIPARVFFMLQTDDMDKIAEIFDEWVSARVAAEWARKGL